MGQADLMEWLRCQPFQPFRIHLSDGASYDIRHPDQASPGILSVFVVTPGHDPSGTPWDVLTTLSMMHITRLVPLPPLAPPSN